MSDEYVNRDAIRDGYNAPMHSFITPNPNKVYDFFDLGINDGFRDQFDSNYVNEYDNISFSGQYELPLESLDEQMGKLNYLIRKYDISLNRMAWAAYRYIQILNDTNKNEEISNLWNDFLVKRELLRGA